MAVIVETGADRVEEINHERYFSLLPEVWKSLALNDGILKSCWVYYQLISLVV